MIFSFCRQPTTVGEWPPHKELLRTKSCALLSCRTRVPQPTDATNTEYIELSVTTLSLVSVQLWIHYYANVPAQGNTTRRMQFARVSHCCRVVENLQPRSRGLPCGPTFSHGQFKAQSLLLKLIMVINQACETWLIQSTTKAQGALLAV